MKSMWLSVGSSSESPRRGPCFSLDRYCFMQMELLASLMKTKDSTLDTRRVRSTTFAIGFYRVLDGAFGLRPSV
jgi:hypothetical protein